MSLRPLSFDHAIKIASLWKAAGGNTHLDIGALEPLLWREGQRRINDLVAALNDTGFAVSMTTNGLLLERFAHDLRVAGLRLIFPVDTHAHGLLRIGLEPGSKRHETGRRI